MHLAAQHRPASIVFRQQRIAVIEKPRRVARPGQLEQPALGVIDQARLDRAGITGAGCRAGRRDLRPRLDQPVLDFTWVGIQCTVTVICHSNSGSQRVGFDWRIPAHSSQRLQRLSCHPGQFRVASHF